MTLEEVQYHINNLSFTDKLALFEKEVKGFAVDITNDVLDNHSELILSLAGAILIGGERSALPIWLSYWKAKNEDYANETVFFIFCDEMNIRSRIQAKFNQELKNIDENLDELLQ